MALHATVCWHQIGQVLVDAFVSKKSSNLIVGDRARPAMGLLRELTTLPETSKSVKGSKGRSMEGREGRGQRQQK